MITGIMDGNLLQLIQLLVYELDKNIKYITCHN